MSDFCVVIKRQIIIILSALLLMLVAILPISVLAETIKAFQKAVYHSYPGDSTHVLHDSLILEFLEKDEKISLQKAHRIAAGEHYTRFKKDVVPYSAQLHESDFSSLLAAIANDKDNMFLGVAIYNDIGFARGFYGARPVKLLMPDGVIKELKNKVRNQFEHGELNPMAVVKEFACRELVRDAEKEICIDKIYGIYRPVISDTTLGYSLILISEKTLKMRHNML